MNSFFVAGTAYLLCTMGYAHFGNSPTTLVGATLYLLNFATPNLQLAGLVDAGEAFFLMAVVVSMFFQRWWLLPALGILGALTKESFVPFSVTMAGDDGPFGKAPVLIVSALAFGLPSWQ